MPPIFRLRLLLITVSAALCVPVAFAANVAADAPLKQAPSPAVSLPLDLLGYRPLKSANAMRAGYTNATVNFIDSNHLLLTYTARKLITRLPDQRERDDDHLVRAVVLHLPDGKVLRETEWRLHDRAPYLWALSKGRFILRVRGDLFSLDPMGTFNPTHLGERTLLESDDELQNLEFSPEHDLMLLETAPPAKIGDDPSERRQLDVTATFFRVDLSPEGVVKLTSRGRAISHHPFSLSYTSMGLLETVKEDRTHWGFDFRSFSGKKLELAGFTSTCRPRSVFISDAEFFAFGCRGGEERKLMGGFNLLSEAKWVFTTDDEPLWLSVAASPSAGRFAMRNTLTTVGMQGSDKPDADEIRHQEVRVYSSREGEELLRVTASPTQRPNGNFDLSPDGLRLAVLRGTQMEIYNLPPVPEADRKVTLKEQQMLGPLRPAAEVSVAPALARPPQDAP